jgi:hypothetical protein
MKREIAKGKSYTFTWRFYDKAVQLKPDSASVIIKNKSGTTIIADNCSVSDTTGDITFILVDTYTATLDFNYKVELIYNVGGSPAYYFELFDVVNTPLVNITTDDDLFVFVKELRSQIIEKAYQTTEAGDTDQLRCLDLVQDTRSYKGGFLDISIPNSDGETFSNHSARIISYEQSSGTCIFTPEYTVDIPEGANFRIRSSFSLDIETAFNEFVIDDIRRKVGIAARYIDSNVCRLATTFKALQIICSSAVEIADDKWDLRAKRFMQEYKDKIGSISEPVDLDDDSNISSSENDNRPSMSTVELLV